MKIILELPQELTAKQRHRLRILFNDAFGEFVSRRGGHNDAVERYVRERYAHFFGPDAEAKYVLTFEEKVQQVKERIELAEIVNRAELTVEPE